jgi:hypothetical protein
MCLLVVDRFILQPEGCEEGGKGGSMVGMPANSTGASSHMRRGTGGSVGTRPPARRRKKKGAVKEVAEPQKSPSKKAAPPTCFTLLLKSPPPHARIICSN